MTSASQSARKFLFALAALVVATVATPSLGGVKPVERKFETKFSFIPKTISKSAYPSETRLALIMGNANYRHAEKLANPANDARAIAQSLQKLNFQTTLLLDATKSDTIASIDQLLAKARASTDAVVLFYYGGHALSIGPENYILPTDADIKTVDQVPVQALSLNRIMLEIERANKSGLTFIVADACRDNPFAMQLQSSRSRSLARVSARFGELDPGLNAAVLLSTQPDAVALDVVEGKPSPLSPFAAAHVKYSAMTGLEWRDFARGIQNEVLEQTNGFQRPDFKENLRRDFFYAPLFDFNDAQRVAEVVPPITRAARALVATPKGELKPTYIGSYALLIGVSTYDDTTTWRNLPGVKEDIPRVKEALEKIHGFETTVVMDPDYRKLDDTLREFIAVHGAKQDARLIVYFAGHGYTTSNGPNKIGWVIPKDTPSYATAPQKFAVTALNMRRVHEYSENIAAKHVLWIFDSCFSGQAIGMLARRSPDFSPFEQGRLKKPVRRIITSGSEKEEVPDQSIFARLLVQALRGEVAIGTARRDVFTGNQLGDFLKRHVEDETAKTLGGARTQRPQSATIVFPALDEGDVIFTLEPDLIKTAEKDGKATLPQP